MLWQELYLTYSYTIVTLTDYEAGINNLYSIFILIPYRVGKAMKEILEEEGLEVSLWDPKDSPYTILEQPLHLVSDTVRHISFRAFVASINDKFGVFHLATRK